MLYSHMAITSDWAPTFVGTDAPAPTSEGMLKHLKQYGLDNAHETGYRGKPVRYKSYKQLREDTWIHVARSVFAEETYSQLVAAAGYAEFDDEARADWKELHEQEA